MQISCSPNVAVVHVNSPVQMKVCFVHYIKSGTVIYYQLEIMLRISMRNSFGWPYCQGTNLEQKRFYMIKLQCLMQDLPYCCIWDLHVPRYCPNTVATLYIHHLLFDNSNYNFFNLLVINCFTSSAWLLCYSSCSFKSLNHVS